MTDLLTWLRRPYPFESAWPHMLRNGAWGGVFVWLFLYFFKPFGTQIDADEQWAYFGTCFQFGLVTFGVFGLVGGLCRVFPHILKEEGWAVWKEIVFTVFTVSLIGLGNLLLAHRLFGLPLTLQNVWDWQVLTFIVGIFPTVFGVFLGQIKLQKRYAAAAASLNQQIETHHKSPPAAPADTAQTVTLRGDNQGELLSLEPEQIRYLAAADNYVQVFFVKNGTLKSTMLRTTLRKMEDALAQWPQFFRCHRTYLVNLDQVTQVSGNAQGYRLHLEGLDETVPVSRNLNEAISLKFLEV